MARWCKDLDGHADLQRPHYSRLPCAVDTCKTIVTADLNLANSSRDDFLQLLVAPVDGISLYFRC